MKAKLYSSKYILEVETSNLEKLIRLKNQLEGQGFTIRVKPEPVVEEINIGWTTL